jgi:hypothetical protein
MEAQAADTRRRNQKGRAWADWGPHESWRDYVAALAALGPEYVGFDVTQVVSTYPRQIPGINLKTLHCETREEFEEKIRAV